MRITPNQETVQNEFLPFKDDPVFQESAELIIQGRDLVEMLQALAMVPGGLRTLAAASNAVYPGGSIDRLTKELVILEASRMNNCQFCLNSHIDICQSGGLSTDPMTLLEDDSAQTDAQRAAVAFVRAAIHDNNSIPDAVFDKLRSCFTDSQIAELALLLGYVSMLNMFNNTLQVQYKGDYCSSPD